VVAVSAIRGWEIGVRSTHFVLVAPLTCLSGRVR